ncbi:MAG: hypothetical protein GX117_05455, partial [Candidatus Hydrogenedentes bacterium]|nr:hypothetical protein [Candidatus Hydrogenedentota bacterium]
ERLRPIMEEALQSDDTHHWPLITLNINDIRGDAPGLHRAVYDLIRSYEPWLCTAPKGAEPLPVAPITLKPMLILAGGGARERAHFYDAVPVGGSLFIFGSGNAERPADNFRRWINYSWRDVEPQGQPQAGAWTEEAAARLNALVSNAHKQGYWIRFYGLDGRNPIVHLGQGGNPGYNFGSLEAVQQRWKAAVVAGVDFIATDQIQDAVDFKKSLE